LSVFEVFFRAPFHKILQILGIVELKDIVKAGIKERRAALHGIKTVMM
jgi:high-affinity K+ transport system ATPase subunit B